MSDFVLYARIEDAWVPIATFADRDGYFAAIQRFFDMKAAEGAPQQPCDIVLGLMRQPTVVARGKFGLVKRGLRHFDEIGISNELVEAIDEAKASGATAVGWGADAEGLADIPPYDFGNLEI